MKAWRAELYHYGIKGQKWGVRNGPPYPLHAKDHSASEKRAGWRKSLLGGTSGGLFGSTKSKNYRPSNAEISEAAKRAARGSVHADANTQRIIADTRQRVYERLGGKKKLDRNKMLTYQQKTYSDDDYTVKKGQEVQHITLDPNMKLGPHARGGHLYVSTNEVDNKNYAGLYSGLRMLNDPRIKHVYAMKFKAADDLVTPSKKRRVENFLQMYYDNPVSFANDMAAWEQRYGLSYESTKKIAKRYMKMSLDELSTEGYERFASSWAMRTNTRDAYWERLKSQGYNAVMDDNDIKSGYFQSNTPLIVFNAVDHLAQVSIKELTKAEAVRNMEEWNDMAHTGL